MGRRGEASPGLSSHHQVADRRQDEQGEGGGCDQAADDHGGQGLLHLCPGAVRDRHGHEAERRDQGSRFVALRARPKIEIEDDIEAEFHAARPDRCDQFRYPAEILSEPGVIRPDPLKVTVPPLITSGPLVIKQLPLNVILPLVKVLLPSM